MTQTVDFLFTNAHVLTMDENLNQYNPGAIAVNGDSIVAVGPEFEISKEYSGKEIIDCGRRILMPGLINAHTHVPMNSSARPSRRLAARCVADGLYDAGRTPIRITGICPAWNIHRLRRINSERRHHI